MWPLKDWLLHPFLKLKSCGLKSVTPPFDLIQSSVTVLLKSQIYLNLQRTTREKSFLIKETYCCKSLSITLKLGFIVKIRIQMDWLAFWLGRTECTDSTGYRMYTLYSTASQQIRVSSSNICFFSPPIRWQHPLIRWQHSLIRWQHPLIRWQHPLIRWQHSLISCQHSLVSWQHLLISCLYPITAIILFTGHSVTNSSSLSVTFLPCDITQLTFSRSRWCDVWWVYHIFKTKWS